MKPDYQVKTNSAYLMVSFYTALRAYIDSFDPRPADMVAEPDGNVSAEDWLRQAASFVEQIPEQRAKLTRFMMAIEELVSQKQYGSARRLTDKGTRESDAQIRALGRGEV
ncbi:MAG: hypothetical protein GC204_08600 [Chloroflexi bacterium]|nr:hypothetical protein [Chloroflexota bacterium]